MLDTQSDSSFITDSTCNKLGVDGPETEIIISTLSSCERVPTRKIKNIMVRGYYSKERLSMPVMFSTTDVPGDKEHVPTCNTATQWTHLQHLQHSIPPLLDIEFGLLIGYNCSQALTPRQVIPSKTNAKEPYALLTDLGWSIIGGKSSQGIHDCHVISAKPSTTAIVLRSKVKEVFQGDKFWSTSVLCEEPSMGEEKKQSYDDYRFMQIMTENVCEVDGHLQMPLPLKNDVRSLPSNMVLASRRLDHLKKRFAIDKRSKTLH
jgi:hypothetical protein